MKYGASNTQNANARATRTAVQCGNTEKQQQVERLFELCEHAKPNAYKSNMGNQNREAQKAIKAAKSNKKAATSNKKATESSKRVAKSA